jgi:hypothetical protein
MLVHARSLPQVPSLPIQDAKDHKSKLLLSLNLAEFRLPASGIYLQFEAFLYHRSVMDVPPSTTTVVRTIPSINGSEINNPQFQGRYIHTSDNSCESINDSRSPVDTYKLQQRPSTVRPLSRY